MRIFEQKFCNICGKETSKKRNGDYRKTCYGICKTTDLRERATKNSFGGETNYKKFKYNNIWMDSSWEVKLAIFLDENNIIWERSRKHCILYIDKQSVQRRYYPDFYLPDLNIYLDPKNPYKASLDEEKLRRVLTQNNIVLVTGTLNEVLDDMKSILECYKTF